jgi:hypothetical protein
VFPVPLEADSEVFSAHSAKNSNCQFLKNARNRRFAIAYRDLCYDFFNFRQKWAFLLKVLLVFAKNVS